MGSYSGGCHAPIRQPIKLPQSPRQPSDHLCIDEETSCKGWSTNGECGKNADYMLRACRKSCGVCDPDDAAAWSAWRPVMAAFVWPVAAMSIVALSGAFLGRRALQYRAIWLGAQLERYAPGAAALFGVGASLTGFPMAFYMAHFQRSASQTATIRTDVRASMTVALVITLYTFIGLSLLFIAIAHRSWQRKNPGRDFLPPAQDRAAPGAIQEPKRPQLMQQLRSLLRRSCMCINLCIFFHAMKALSQTLLSDRS